MLSKLRKIFNILYRIEQDSVSYRELIEFFYGETPPVDHNFLNYNYAPHTSKIIKYGRSAKTKPLFSVIIPTYNRSELLLKTLNSVISQNNISPAEFELVIVDNGSKDKTEKTVESFAYQNGKTSIVYVKLKRNYGADFARNVAALESWGKFLAFTDDDCIVPPDWLFWFKREFDTNPEIAGVGGFKVPRSTRERLDIYHRFLMWEQFRNPHIRTKVSSAFRNRCGLTANVCYRRDVFEKLGGFNLYFKHIGFREFQNRVHKSGIKLLYEPKMVEHFAYFPFSTHVLKLFVQGWDWYLQHVLYPNSWPNPSFLFLFKRTIRGIRTVLTSEKQLPLYNKSFSDIVIFSFLSIITNFSLWFGKYWIPLKMTSDPRFASHDTSF
ncbi:MAG: hypothetical protein A3B89_03100 [Candidatus Buchananbacteria bacterium RIFCSPHIGHO2_02_FULL_40_13]|nr:MAG: hypothetical protein A3B89_03100 [Candidatus Buchananbacteria bacterium RIFCSPHIGHO2_02_FULL_40_13]